MRSCCRRGTVDTMNSQGHRRNCCCHEGPAGSRKTAVRSRMTVRSWIPAHTKRTVRMRSRANLLKIVARRREVAHTMMTRGKMVQHTVMKIVVQPRNEERSTKTALVQRMRLVCEKMAQRTTMALDPTRELVAPTRKAVRVMAVVHSAMALARTKQVREKMALPHEKKALARRKTSVRDTNAVDRMTAQVQKMTSLWA